MRVFILLALVCGVSMTSSCALLQLTLCFATTAGSISGGAPGARPRHLDVPDSPVTNPIVPGLSAAEQDRFRQCLPRLCPRGTHEQRAECEASKAQKLGAAMFKQRWLGDYC